ncbi:MAG: hypothetical protein KGL95_11455, partial [Patescibacteria group bacterium]|nr:hypothetical protein [Patescibacteria group bacterium]
ITPQDLQNLVGENATLNMTPDELQKVLGANSTLDVTPQDLQNMLYRNSTLGVNASLSFSRDDLGNLSASLNKLSNQTNNSTQENNSSPNLLYVTCAIKKTDLGKFFENFSIPLSSCKINE